jgi:POT family proton-dependent oligopeptide transporter
MGKLMFGTFLIAVPGILIWALTAGNRVEFQMMVAAMVLIVFNTVFWTLFEQAGSSLTLFAERNTMLEVGWTRPLVRHVPRYCRQLLRVLAAVLLGGLGWALAWFFGQGEVPATRRKLNIGFGVVMLSGFARHGLCPRSGLRQ